MTKTCIQCGSELRDEARFCDTCGAPQDGAAGAQARVEGSGAAAQQGGVAAGAGGVAIGGDVRDSVILTEDRSDVIGRGGIHAGRIEADSVVDGAQVRGIELQAIGELTKLVRAIRRGGITADQIRAGNVVSGLQFFAGTAPATRSGLRGEVTALHQELQRAIAAGEIAAGGAVRVAQEALAQAQAEMDGLQPDGTQVVRQLEAAATVLTRAAEPGQVAGETSQPIVRLAAVAVALWGLAEDIWGG